MAVRMTWTGNEHKARVRGATVRAMTRTMNEAAQTAAGHAPVRTGQLRDSMKTLDVSERGAVVHGEFGSDGSAPHAIFIEIGTRYIQAQFPIRRAADEVFPRFPGYFRAEVS